jgi:subtilisin family serine protease
LVVVALSLFLSGLVSAEYFEGWLEDPNQPKYVEGELLVRFAKKLDGQIPTKLERRAVLTALGGAQETGSYWLVPGLTVVKLPDGVTVQQALTRFNAKGEILYAQPNWICRTLETPNDPKFNEQWGLNNTGQTGGAAGADVNAPEAWDLGMGTREIVVAVIDSGVDYNHPDLARNMWVNHGEIPGNGLALPYI